MVLRSYESPSVTTTQLTAKIKNPLISTLSGSASVKNHSRRDSQSYPNEERVGVKRLAEIYGVFDNQHRGLLNNPIRVKSPPIPLESGVIFVPGQPTTISC